MVQVIYAFVLLCVFIFRLASPFHASQKVTGNLQRFLVLAEIPRVPDEQLKDLLETGRTLDRSNKITDLLSAQSYSPGTTGGIHFPLAEVSVSKWNCLDPVTFAGITGKCKLDARAVTGGMAIVLQGT